MNINVPKANVELPIHYAELESIYSQTIDRGLRSVAITSCVGGEGTTTLACALAKRAQAGGRKTLLVDMNFCSPNIGMEMGLDMGLRDRQWRCLDNHLSEQIESLELSTGSVGNGQLSILPAPSTPTGNLMLREKHYLAQCMEAWLTEYDLVVVDTSPLNAINRHNLPAERICSECEGTVLTVMAGVTQQTQVQAAMSKLDRYGIELSGCVFNDLVSPTLAEEVIRQSYRLQPWLPSLMEWVRGKIRASSMMNMTV